MNTMNPLAMAEKKATNSNFNLLDYHINMTGKEIALYYKGPFDEGILNRISRRLQNKFSESHPRAAKKLFSVFMELAQNIAYYSEESNLFVDDDKSAGVGAVVIQESEQYLTFTAGNLIRKSDEKFLLEKAELINSMNYKELRMLKKEIRSRPRSFGHKGGNIGLIQVAIKSENPVEAGAVPIDEKHSFFLLETSIAKS